MKKILLGLLTTLIIFNCLILGVNAATITSDQLDIDGTYIKMPSTLKSGAISKVELNGIDGGLGYYQIINVTNDEELYNAYTATQTDSTKIDALVTLLNNNSDIIDDGSWTDSIPENGEITPEFEASNGDKMLLIVKYQSQTNTKYNLKTYNVEATVSSNTNKNNDTSNNKNPDTGIEDWYLVVVPVAIIAGAVLLTKKNRYE